MMIEYAVLLSHNIIAGQMIGNKGLSALSLVSPYYSVLFFLAYLLSTGINICMSRRLGEMNRKGANAFFTTGVYVNIAVGFVFSVVTFLIKEPILQSMDISEELYELSNQYLNGMCALPLILPVFMLVYDAVVTEGDENLCIVGDIVEICTNILLSTVFCYFWGMFGIGLAGVCSYTLAMLVLLIHFKKKSNQLHLKGHVTVREYFSTYKYGLLDALLYLLDAISLAIMNSFVLAKFTEEALAILAIISNIRSFVTSALDSVGQAMMPLISVYVGEKNVVGVKKMAKITMKATIITGILLSTILLGGSHWIAVIMGVEGEILASAEMAIRIFSVTVLFFAIILTFATYYTYCGYIGWAIYFYCMQYLVVQNILLVLGGIYFGMTGMWWGLTIASPVTLGLCLLSVKIFNWHQAVFLVDRVWDGSPWTCFEFRINQEEIKKLSESLKKYLEHQEIADEVCEKVCMVTEELAIDTARKYNHDLNEKHKRKHEILAECSIHIKPEEIEILFRDNSKEGSIGVCETGEEDEEVRRGVQLIKELTSEHEYIITTSFNKYRCVVKNSF